MSTHVDAELLDHLAVGVVVLDAEGEELHRSRSVEGLLVGTALARPDKMARRLRALAQRSRATGDAEVESFEPLTDGAAGVRATAKSLASGGAVVTLEPMSSSPQVEERVRQFVSHVTHDLRTPLTSVLGASDLLLSGRIGSPDERHARLLKIVGEGTQKMANQLSELSARFIDPEVGS